MPAFDTRDPDRPEFWTERFEHGYMPWDQGGVPDALRQFVHAAPAPMTVLIPGCGAGYEVAYLSEAGWDVTAIDFSEAAVATARQALGRWGSRVTQADFFTFMPERRIDLIYERAFLCALPPSRAPEIAARWAQLLPTGGLLAGFFYFDDQPKGPPFGIAPSRLDELLSPAFRRIESRAAADSIPIFAGKEEWQVWQRR
jgi:SAM-dependent methyltransferase